MTRVWNRIPIKIFFLTSLSAFGAGAIPDSLFILSTGPRISDYRLFDFQQGGNQFRYLYQFQSVLAFAEFYALSAPGRHPVIMLHDSVTRQVYRHDGVTGTYAPYKNVAALGQFADERVVVLLDDESVHLIAYDGASTLVGAPGKLMLKGNVRAITGVSDTHVLIVTEEQLIYVKLNFAGAPLVEADVDLKGYGKTHPVLQKVNGVRAGKTGAWLSTENFNGSEHAFAYFPYSGRNVKIYRWPPGTTKGFSMLSIDATTEALIAKFETHLVTLDRQTLNETTLYPSAFRDSRLALLSPAFLAGTLLRFSQPYSIGTGAAPVPNTSADRALAEFLAIFKAHTDLPATNFCVLANQNEPLLARLKNLSPDVLARHGLTFRGYYLDPIPGAGKVDLKALGQAVVDAEISCAAHTKAAGADHVSLFF